MTTNETFPKSMSNDDIVGLETPCYIFNKPVFVDNFIGLTSAFRRRYKNFDIAYSYKTNSTKAVIQTVKALEGLAEVVSPYELERAIKCNRDYSRIVYNGVIPDPEGKISVAYCGGIVNIDNLDELKEIDHICTQNEQSIKIGLRLNFDIGVGFDSRFGFRIGEPEYEEAVNLINASEFLHMNSIHCHISCGRGLEFWKRRVETMIKTGKELGVKVIDLGSNLYGPMDERLSTQFNDTIPSFVQYAETVCKPMAEAFPDMSVKLIIEAGTPIIANAVDFATRVVNIKSIAGKKLATIDGSFFNLGFLVKVKKVPMDVINLKRVYPENYDLYGYTCTEGDLVQEGYEGYLGVGDVVVFRNVGAYSRSLCPSQFIMPPPKTITYALNGSKPKDKK